tara:strand:- start:258 stop:470 length:213 start_codon:yes stop_codon:yes gene_type:complete
MIHAKPLRNESKTPDASGQQQHEISSQQHNENPGNETSPKNFGQITGLQHIASQKQNQKLLLGEPICTTY